MKKYSWFLLMALMAFACQVQDDNVTLSKNASGRTSSQPGFNYVITSSTTDGFTWTFTIDQSAAHNISHLIFYNMQGCGNTGALSVSNITAATVNGQNWMSQVTSSIGNGDVCKPLLAGSAIKLDNFNVNGGTATVVVTFDTQVASGSFLINSAHNCVGSGDPAYSFSHDCSHPCDQFQDETGWATGSRYVSRGNWATYTAYQAGTVNIYAGQNMFAGTATMSAVSGGMVTISIVINSGWSLQDPSVQSQPVKIQGYDVAPSGNPSPGRFANKGTSLTVTLPAANFYGIHLDLKHAICPN